MIFLIHLYLFVVLFQLIYSRAYEETPKITFSSTSKNVVNERVRYNVTFFKLIDNKRTFTLKAECAAKYPVEWNIIDSPLKTKFLENRRNYTDWRDPETFYFSSTLEILVDNHLFSGKIEEFSYSCQCTFSKCLEDNLYFHAPYPDRSYILVAVNPIYYSLNKARKCNWTNSYNMTLELRSHPMISENENANVGYTEGNISIIDFKPELMNPANARQFPIGRSFTCLAHENFFSKGSVIGYKRKGVSSIHYLKGDETIVQIQSEKYYSTSAVLPGWLNNNVIEYVYCMLPLWNTFGWWYIKQISVKITPVTNLQTRATTFGTYSQTDLADNFTASRIKASTPTKITPTADLQTSATKDGTDSPTDFAENFTPTIVTQINASSPTKIMPITNSQTSATKDGTDSSPTIFPRMDAHISTQNIPITNFETSATDASTEFMGTFTTTIVTTTTTGNSDIKVHYFYFSIFAVVILAVLCLVLIALTWIILSIRKRRMESKRGKRLLPELKTLMTPPRHSYLEILEPISWHEILISDLTVYETMKLGQGNFGLVLKGTLRTESGVVEVAVKKPLTPDPYALNLLKKELRISSKIGRHNNIVQVLGAVMENFNYDTNISYVVLEYCALGNLREYLRNNKSEFEPTNTEPTTINNHSPPMLTLVSWSIDIARGMHFLATQKIVHGDLAARNVLLSADKSLKLSDFGLSKELQEYYYCAKRNETPMPWKWMSYESLKHQKFSTKSDIWSYGVTLWEIFTLGDTPWVGCKCTNEFIENLEVGLRPQQPTLAPCEIYELMKECWALQTTCRPPFGTIIQKLQSIYKKLSQQSAMRLLNGASSDDYIANYYLTPIHTTNALL